MFILVDDENRENEGDLVIPGSKCNSKVINFMATRKRINLFSINKKQIDKLRLPLMSPINKSRMQTAFTISIEARKGISTGISAFDRAKTIKVAINQIQGKRYCFTWSCISFSSKKWRCVRKSRPYRSFYRHIKIIKFNPSSVICEVMNEDGRMARLNDLFKFSKKHKIKIASITDLIAHRLKMRNLFIELFQKFS